MALFSSPQGCRASVVCIRNQHNKTSSEKASSHVKAFSSVWRFFLFATCMSPFDRWSPSNPAFLSFAAVSIWNPTATDRRLFSTPCKQAYRPKARIAQSGHHRKAPDGLFADAAPTTNGHGILIFDNVIRGDIHLRSFLNVLLYASSLT